MGALMERTVPPHANGNTGKPIDSAERPTRWKQMIYPSISRPISHKNELQMLRSAAIHAAGELSFSLFLTRTGQTKKHFHFLSLQVGSNPITAISAGFSGLLLTLLEVIHHVGVGREIKGSALPLRHGRDAIYKDTALCCITYK